MSYRILVIQVIFSDILTTVFYREVSEEQRVDFLYNAVRPAILEFYFHDQQQFHAAFERFARSQLFQGPSCYSAAGPVNTTTIDLITHDNYCLYCL